VLALIPFLFFPAAAVPVEVPGTFVYAAIAANDADASVSVFITPSESVAPGTLVKLDASKSDAETFLWTLASDDQTLYDVANDGRTAYFSSGAPGTYTFILSVAKSAGEGKPPVLKTAKRSVVVKGAAPGPGPVNPDPQPKPTPVDPLTPGKYGLARLTRDSVVGAIASTDRAVAAGFSVNYQNIASEIDSGKYGTVQAAQQELTRRNQNTAGTQLDKWKVPVFKPIGDKIAELAKAGTLSITNLQDMRNVFLEISQGFAAATGN
jgi:hypothetical protein